MNSLLFRRYRDIASALQDFLMGGEVIGRLIAVATARASPVVHGYGFSENADVAGFILYMFWKGIVVGISACLSGH